MSRFLDPPAAKPQLPENKVDRTYKMMRIKVFLGAFLGYAGYYLVRKNLSLAAPEMIDKGILDAGKLGLAMSAVSIAYAFSKFIMGSVSHPSDPWTLLRCNPSSNPVRKADRRTQECP